MTDDARKQFDTQMMGVALGLAQRGLGTTWPNPAVGAVIAEETSTEIIARGWTLPGGRPHAETEALTRAGERARGATMYVTLEPCSHFGRTPPCADAIIKAGIKRVVVAQSDPDPRVAGRGITRLDQAGIEVTRTIRHNEARRITRGHILRVTERRPYIQLKIALGAHGGIARGTGAKPVWVTGPIARAHGHMLRAKADAILVGARTVEDDNPDLTCRLPGLADRSPVRVVLSGSHLPAPATTLTKTARDVPVWVMTGAALQSGNSDPASNAASSIAKARELQDLGCQLIPVTTVGRKIWLPALAETLVAKGITRLLVEGGPTIWRGFAHAGLVDEVVVFRARAVSKTAHQADTTGEADTRTHLSPLLPGLDLTLVEKRPLGDDDEMLIFQTQ